MDGSASPSEAEEDPAAAGELPEDELERKRRKQVEEIPPRYYLNNLFFTYFLRISI